jgi:hypothetical protein
MTGKFGDSDADYTNDVQGRESAANIAAEHIAVTLSFSSLVTFVLSYLLNSLPGTPLIMQTVKCHLPEKKEKNIIHNLKLSN